MDPQNLLQYKPKTDEKGKPLYLQKLEEKLAKEEKRRIKDKGIEGWGNWELTMVNEGGMEDELSIRGWIVKNDGREIKDKIWRIKMWDEECKWTRMDELRMKD